MIGRGQAGGRALCIGGVALAIGLFAHRGSPLTGRPARAVGGSLPGPQIAVVGDSVAYGARDVVRGGWVTRLEGMLARDYPDARPRLSILNAADNGGTFANLTRALQRVRRRASPALLIVAYGLNDFDERVPRPAMEAHLRAGLRSLAAWPRPPAAILMGMPPITALPPARLAAERAYTDVILRVALAERAGYIDEFDLWLALGPRYLHTLRSDTEHPNRLGYTFTAATVAAYLEGAHLDARGRISIPATPPACAPSVCGP